MEVLFTRMQKAINHILMHTENTLAFSGIWFPLGVNLRAFGFRTEHYRMLCVCILGMCPPASTCVRGPCASYSACFSYIKRHSTFSYSTMKKQLRRLWLTHTHTHTPDHTPHNTHTTHTHTHTTQHIYFIYIFLTTHTDCALCQLLCAHSWKS